MKASAWRMRRVLLGMSIEDAQSKFDSPESRTFLRIAHERHNEGIMHEIQLAQRQRDKLPPEKKCHVTRYAKPSVKGFQGLLKQKSDDFTVRELWNDAENVKANSPSSAPESGTQQGGAVQSAVLGKSVVSEKDEYLQARELMLGALRNALDTVKEGVLEELEQRKRSGALITGAQTGIVNQMVEDLNDSTDKNYKSLSSSNHLLEPVQMEATLAARKDKDVISAFKSTALSVPAKESNISYSLWVAGGVMADAKATENFPFHVAKFVVADDTEDNSNTLPKVDVEVYFSSELYQLQNSIGKSGVAALRQFIGRTMMRQHEPVPVSPTLMLSCPQDERVSMNLYNPNQTERIRVPWLRRSTLSIMSFDKVGRGRDDNHGAEESVQHEEFKKSISLVWRAWGHLIKDLHVCGDLDNLYVSVDRRKEASENAQVVDQLQSRSKSKNTSSEIADVVKAEEQPLSIDTEHYWSVNKSRKGKTIYFPLSSDFSVIECNLERKGLPHNMVMEDIVETLTEMQSQSLEMLRLGFLDQLTQSGLPDQSKKVVPVVYAPKIVVSHAGVIENGTHSFQRIRIRGSSRAHIEALIASQNDDTARLTQRDWVKDSMSLLGSKRLPPNLAFLQTHEAQTAARLNEETSLTRSSPEQLKSPRNFSQNWSKNLTSDREAVDEAEAQFWRENFYRLSDPRVVFHSRVNPDEIVAEGKNVSFSPRLQEHLSLISSKIASADGDGDGESSHESGGRARKRSRKRNKKSPSGNPSFSLEKTFEYLCTDMEAESSQFDIHVGECDGYAYDITVSQIPLQQAANVEPALRSLAKKGFINYYGPSRFATYTRMNMHPGLHLLKGEFRAAAHVIVQQFYVDLAVKAEKKRTGSAFPMPRGLNGTSNTRLYDFSRTTALGQRSVAEHGTALQRVLSNALQASLLLRGNEDDEADLNADAVGRGGRSLATRGGKGTPHAVSIQGNTLTSLIESDPCADAFANVIGPNACHVLIREYLSFVWNDLVNQRFQRYGTFSILPGDLVRKHPQAPRGSAQYRELARVTRRDVETGRRQPWEVVLPLPGANIQLPENHTADLYVVTLKRAGLTFNPETRQWDCFYPRQWQDGMHDKTKAAATPGNDGHVGGGDTPLASPYRLLSPSYQLMMEELGWRTPFSEAPPYSLLPASQIPRLGSGSGGARGQFPDGEHVLYDGDVADLNGTVASAEGSSGPTVASPASGHPSGSFFNVAGMRKDLQRQEGNPLGLLVEADYRAPLFNIGAEMASGSMATVFGPSAALTWGVASDAVGNPRHRWGMAIERQRLLGKDGSQGRHHRHREANDPLDDKEQISRYLPLPLPSTTRLPVEYPHTPPKGPSHWRQRKLPLPPTPYWLQQRENRTLKMRFSLPTGVYAGMLLRELTKLDVNSPEIVDVNASPSGNIVTQRQRQIETEGSNHRAVFDRRRRRMLMNDRPQALSLALLHQQIFRSGGVRGSLLPTLRSYDSVSK